MNIKRPTQEFFGVNVIPMIDTMMFLLIFFMMATKFADIERDVSVRPPSSRDARPITEIPREIVVNVTSAGNFMIAGNQRTLEEIDKMLGAAVKNDPHQSVVIRGDRETILQFAVNILDLCEKHGVEHTYLTTRKLDT
ncbi:MAG: biopolymer transporter ExbD [bacterium]